MGFGRVILNGFIGNGRGAATCRNLTGAAKPINRELTLINANKKLAYIRVNWRFVKKLRPAAAGCLPCRRPEIVFQNNAI